MTPAQKKLKELRDKQSKDRQRVAEIGLAEEMTDEMRAELAEIEKATPNLEAQIRAAATAVEAENAEAETRVRETEPDAEMRERFKLRSEARLTEYLLAHAEGRQVTGREAELRAAAGVNGIPIEIFDVPVERRADTATTSPTSGTGVNLDPIYPMIYARSVLPRLGVSMPRVPSGTYSTMTITTGLTAGAIEAGTAKESTAATLSPKTTGPHRVTGRLSLRIEDIATIGVANFESALRQNLMLVMSDELDNLGLNGDPATTAAEPQGLLSQLTDPADPTTVVDFNAFVQLAADAIDGGPWAETLRDVRVLVNADCIKLAERTFQTSTNYQGELAAAAYLREKSGGFFSSSRMPATASTIAQCLRVRMATMGLDGVDAMRLATCPVWAEVGIDDIYSDAASGTRHFTLHSLIGDVLIQQTDAYERVDLKIAA